MTGFVPETSGMATRGEAGTGRARHKTRPLARQPEIAEARRTQKSASPSSRSLAPSTAAPATNEKSLNTSWPSPKFSHFMEENSDLNLGKKKSKTGRTRMTEAAEDARLMKPSPDPDAA